MPGFVHQPVLLGEVLSALAPRPGGRYVDATLGGAGHAAAILEASRPDGWLYGCDRDGVAVEAAERRLLAAGYGGRFAIRRGNYSELAGWIPAESCDGILFDLGVSSPQLDEPDRGFSFQADGPLDMRMDQRQALTAAEIVNGWAEAELSELFFVLGQEPQARRLARAIVRERTAHPFGTTSQLAAFVARIAPRHGQKKHPATRVFQALRMAERQRGRRAVAQRLRRLRAEPLCRDCAAKGIVREATVPEHVLGDLDLLDEVDLGGAVEVAGAQPEVDVGEEERRRHHAARELDEIRGQEQRRALWDLYDAGADLPFIESDASLWTPALQPGRVLEWVPVLRPPWSSLPGSCCKAHCLQQMRSGWLKRMCQAGYLP